MTISEQERTKAPRNPQQRQVRRFRRRRWSGRASRLRPLLYAALTLSLIGVAVWAIYFSSLLTVRDVVVRTGPVVSAAEARSVAAVPMGEPLASVDTGAIRDRLQRLRAVKSVEVSRAWPHTLDIVLTERTAVAVVAQGSSYAGLDADGVVFRDYSSRPRLPLIDAQGGVGRAVLREAAAVLASLPADLARRVKAVHASTIDEISLELRDGKSVHWGSAESAAQKAEVLALMLRPGGPGAARSVTTIDVSVPGRPTTK